MLSAATPSYDFDEEKTQSLEDLDWGGQLDGDNPENFTDTKDRQRI